MASVTASPPAKGFGVPPLYIAAALLAFLLTAADVKFFDIGAPFWGLLIGVAANWVLTYQRGEGVRG